VAKIQQKLKTTSRVTYAKNKIELDRKTSNCIQLPRSPLHHCMGSALSGIFDEH
jgi:hypothetical protein